MNPDHIPAMEGDSATAHQGLGSGGGSEGPSSPAIRRRRDTQRDEDRTSTSPGLVAGEGHAGQGAGAEMNERKKIAAIVTVYRPLSHADVLVTKFLKGFPTDQGL